MRRPSSIEPFTPSPTVTLHPLLQATLDNLDVKVEEELTRYRRQRRYPNQPMPKPASRQISRPASRPSLSLPITQASITQTPEPAPSLVNRQVQQSAPAAHGIPSYRVAASAGFSPAASDSPPEAESFQARSFHNPASAIESPSFARQPESQPEAPPMGGQPTQIQSDAEVEPSHSISSYAEYADLSAYAPSATLQKLMQHVDPQAGPSDYLASSEELLRSIAEEDPESRAAQEPNALMDTLLTPLGIGSMLLLMLSSTMLGYVVMNPASIGLGRDSTESASTGSAASTAGQETVNPIATDRSIVPSPDLSSEEFVDLNLNNLSTLPKKSVVSKPGADPKTKPVQKATGSKTSSTGNQTAASSSSSRSGRNTPANSGSISAPEPQPRLSTVVIPAAPPVVSVPEPAIAPPAPAPVSPEPISAAPPAPEPIEPALSTPASTAAREPAPSRSPSYYVVTEYSGDPSLQEARNVVPDAYVRNLPSEGAKVQLGAFSDEAKAQELQQQLQQQGIEAEIYQP